MKKIKVLFAIGNLDIGGAEKLIINQVKNIDKDKFEPYLCTLFPYGKNNYAEIFHELKNIPYKKFSFKGPLDFSNWLEVYRFLKKENFDILCSHLFESNFIIRVVNLFTGKKPVFIFEHNIYWKKQWWKILSDRFLIKNTKKIFVDSNAILNFTSEQEKIKKETFQILPYPIELSDQSKFNKENIKNSFGLPQNSFVLSSVGRFVEQKGQKYLIEAIPKVLKEINRGDVYFLIVGYGKMEEELKELVLKLNLKSRVIMSSARDIKEVLVISDVFVLSSLWEGQPIAMLEAMDAGCAVVATSVGGIPEIIIDGENGLLAMPKDKDSLSDQMIRVIKDDSLRMKIRENGKIIVKDYSLAVYIRRLESFFIEAYEHRK